MELLFIAIILFFLLWLACVIEEKINAHSYDKHRKWERTIMRTKYRIHITCNGIIMAKTFTGDNFSKVLDKAIDYSLEEADDFPDVVVLVKDIIYL